MQLLIFNKDVKVQEGDVRELYDYLLLLRDSLENEFVVDVTRAPFIDLTSVYFDHTRVDVNDFLMSLAVVPLGANPMTRLLAVADDITTVDLQTCEGAPYPNFRLFKLYPYIVDAARVELLRVIELLLSHFPDLKEVHI